MRRAAHDLTEPGWAILIAIAVLLAVGLASVYVTHTHYATHDDGPKNALKQCVFVLGGMIVAYVVLRIGYMSISRHAYAIFIAALVMLVPLLIARVLHSPLGGLTAPRNGAYRWINLPGFQLQPSEFMKIAYVLALAWYLRYRKNYRRFGGLLRPVAVSAVPLALILLCAPPSFGSRPRWTPLPSAPTSPPMSPDDSPGPRTRPRSHAAFASAAPAPGSSSTQRATSSPTRTSSSAASATGGSTSPTQSGTPWPSSSASSATSGSPSE